MAKKSKTPIELGKRERQIYETVMSLGEASVAEVLSRLENPPSYSAVRATMRLLVDKGWLKYRQEEQRYIYFSAIGKTQAQRTALRRMLSTFFAGSPKDAVVALIDENAKRMTDEELQQIAQIVELARKENR